MTTMKSGSNAFRVIPPPTCYPACRWQKEQGKTGITAANRGNKVRKITQILQIVVSEITHMEFGVWSLRLRWSTSNRDQVSPFPSPKWFVFEEGLGEEKNRVRKMTGNRGKTENGKGGQNPLSPAADSIRHGNARVLHNRTINNGGKL